MIADWNSVIGMGFLKHPQFQFNYLIQIPFLLSLIKSVSQFWLHFISCRYVKPLWCEQIPLYSICTQLVGGVPTAGNVIRIKESRSRQSIKYKFYSRILDQMKVKQESLACLFYEEVKCSDKEVPGWCSFTANIIQGVLYISANILNTEKLFAAKI